MDNSPLSKLPPELRNIIYGLVMSAGTITIMLRNASLDETLVTIDSRKIRQSLALTSTCRQIYQESASLYYAINKFNFTSNDAIKAFVKLIGDDKASAMQRIKINFFACTRLSFGKPFKGNQAARRHLKTMTTLAKRYGWPSLKVRAEFGIYMYHQSVSFDMLDVEKPWIDAISKQPFDPRPYWRDLFGSSKPVQFGEIVEDEVEVWKGILKKLHAQA